MSYLYVSEQGSVLGINGGRLEIRQKDGDLRSIPIETLESIQLFGYVLATTQCISNCLSSIRIYRMIGSGEVTLFGQNVEPRVEDVIII